MNNRTVNIVTIIQARTGSSRLPGKVLLEAAGKPLLLHMVERVRNARFAGNIVVATTEERPDDQIAQLCQENGISCFRGSTNDLLERHYRAALEYSADIVLKIPSDCPLIDPYIIDLGIERFLRYRKEIDYISNLHPATFPDGNDVEVFSFKALYAAFRNARKDYEREHSTPYIWNNPEQFRIANFKWESGLDFSDKYRFILDYAEDFELIKSVFENLYYSNSEFGLNDIIELLTQNPILAKVNRHLRGSSWCKRYSELDHNLKYHVQFQS